MEKRFNLRTKHRYYGGRKLRPIHVGHPLDEQQPQLTNFLDRARLRIARRYPNSIIRPVEHAHFTVMQTGLKRSPLEFVDENKDELEFYIAMAQRIKEIGSGGLTLEVDDRRPIRVLGKDHNKLALNFLMSEALEEECAVVDELVTEFFGEETGLRRLDPPHITFGRIVRGEFYKQDRHNPQHRIVPGLPIPDIVELDEGLNLTLNDRRLEKLYAREITSVLGSIAIAAPIAKAI